jgi:NADPH-dependent 2,4-dienoyl-CoA reductase/sulfur reductase-like enzyme
MFSLRLVPTRLRVYCIMNNTPSTQRFMVPFFSLLMVLNVAWFPATVHALPANTARIAKGRNSGQPRILILGGGVTGVIAARTLHEKGQENFVVIEANERLGGRMRSTRFGNKDKKVEVTVEEGANWVQGLYIF